MLDFERDLNNDLVNYTKKLSNSLNLPYARIIEKGNAARESIKIEIERSIADFEEREKNLSIEDARKKFVELYLELV